MALRAAAALVVLLLAHGCNGGTGEGPPAPPGPGPSPQPPRNIPRVLVVTHTTGFRHDSIPAAESAFSLMSSGTGPFQVDFCRTQEDVVRLLTPSGLSAYAVVAFVNTTGNLGIPDVAALLDWIRAGRGFVGVHSASDTYHDVPAYLDMLGGEFLTHGAIVLADVRVRNQHPAVSHFPGGFLMRDEFYRFTRFNPAAVTVVLGLDRDPDGLGDAGGPADLPLAWHRTFGAGRVFYTALGHPAEQWTDPRFTQHIREAIRWAAGQ
jgi:type 1 glutamine amidotransferase